MLLPFMRISEDARRVPEPWTAWREAEGEGLVVEFSMSWNSFAPASDLPHVAASTEA
jgi:hypothetical protein